MKTGIIVLIIVLAALAFGLPYLLRRNETPPVSEPTATPLGTPEPTPLVTEPARSPSPTPRFTPTSTATPRLSPSPPPQATLSPTPKPSLSPTPKPSPTPSPAAQISVSIANFAFAPAPLTVKKGTKVTWTNQDSVGHTATGDSDGPASSLLNQGGSYSFTFDTVGTFPYHCSPHPFMKGTVTVTE